MDILISRPFPGEGIGRLEQAGHRVRVLADDRPQSEFYAALSQSDAAISLLSDPISAEHLRQCPRLRVLANYAVGFNNIDIAAATAAGIAVSNTPHVLTDATADVTMILILDALRRVPEALDSLRRGEFTGWKPIYLLGQDLAGKNLGILGMGRIGEAVARRAEAFGMRILYHTRSGAKPGLPWPAVSFEALLAESDVLSLHCPLTAETTHLIGWNQLQRMKRTAVLINTSRGPVVDEAALARALREKVIFAAGLDVYEREPIVHPDLLNVPNAVLLPHIGSGTIETRSRMGTMAAECVLAVLAGQLPPYPVNPDVRNHPRWGKGTL
ncbi:MAG TPA: D-glycerate dehydrogenase [Candidatus Ozemobacteraceae bacterium]|nr:D-glycerate dehydrogenase [Candidatus Ozemobacteraceae bacterium]